MEPRNLHELVIAQAVDKKLLECSAERASIIRDVALSLEFDMTPEDSQFLVKYVIWRITQTAASG